MRLRFILIFGNKLIHSYNHDFNYHPNLQHRTIHSTIYSDDWLVNKKILTKREKEVFELLVNNFTTKEIATKLGISEKTVRNHISNAMQKLGVKGRAGAVVELLKLKEIKLDM